MLEKLLQLGIVILVSTTPVGFAEISRQPVVEAEKAKILDSKTPSKISQRKTLGKLEKPQETVKSGSDSVWDRLAQCESGGRWDYNGSSGFDGGIQFLPSTWTAMGTGYDYAWQAPREVQIEAGKKLQAQSGWGQWPSCARQLGLL